MKFELVYPGLEFPHHFCFDEIHYYSNMYDFSTKHWLCWTEQETITKTYLGIDYNEFQRQVEVQKVKAMIQLNVFDGEIILQFFEIAKSHQSRGFSNVMIDALINHITPLISNNKFSRTRPSQMGKERLFDRLSERLNQCNIKWRTI